MWDLALSLDSDNREIPLFLQIARQIAEGIQSGRLTAGERLPGSRSLAKTLSVHRNTVLAAYDELVSQGWLVQEEAKGTFVSMEIPIERVLSGMGAPQEMSETLGYPLLPLALLPYEAMPGGDVIALAGGMADLSVFPMQEWARAYRRCLRLSGEALLGYGDPKGYGPLRAGLAKMLAARRGVLVGEDDLLLTRGSQMALSLVARALIRPGDVVAVEEYGYEPAWTALRLAGAHLVPVAVDEDGLVISDLERWLSRGQIRAVYTTPHHQYPTQAHLYAGRRLQLLALAREHQFAVIEDDYDHEFHYDGHPILPLASADPDGSVVYIGSLSKVLAPSLRLGYVAAPGPLIATLARLRRYVDRQGAQVEEAALAELFEDGLIERHIRRMKRTYHKRRDILADALREHFGDVLAFGLPKGGMSIWAEVDASVDVAGWCERCLEEGVAITHGGQYHFDRLLRPYVRLGFALHDEERLVEAVQRMKRALRRD